MHGRRITPEIGRQMARARWDRYHASKPDREPRFVRYFPLQIGLRDTRTGEEGWTELRSVRQALRLVGNFLRHWQPSPRSG